MEEFRNRLQYRGTDIHSDTSNDVRCRKRPLTRSQDRGMDFVDMGSDFVQVSKPSQETSKFQNGPASTTLRVSHDPNESGDELDLLSSEAALRHDSSSPERQEMSSCTRQTRSKSAVESEKGAFINGTYHEWHPDHKPKSKLPSFRKNKKATNADLSTVSQPSQSSTSSTKAGTRSGRSTRASTPQSPGVPQQSRATSSRTVPKAACMTTGKMIDNNRAPGPVKRINGRQKAKKQLVDEYSENENCEPDAEHIVPDVEDGPQTPRPTASQRPKPRPAFQGPQRRKVEAFPGPSPLASANEDSVDPGAAQRGKSKVRPFPLSLLPQEEKAGQVDTDGKGKGNEKKHVGSRSGRVANGSDPFATLSPLSSQKQENRDHRDAATLPEARSLQAFPLSPPSSPMLVSSSQPESGKENSSQASKVIKGRARADIVSPVGSEIGQKPTSPSYHRIRPFPMETQVFESIRNSPGKRASSEGDGAEQSGEVERQRKKKRPEPNEILAELLRSDEEYDFDEDDLLFLDRNVDPNSLCPWCDERLPSAPTQHLSALIAAARRASTPDPRPTNALGLSAPVGVFIDVCQRHAFERHHIPLAQRSGWPTEIDWNRVGARVQALKSRLQEIINDVDEEFLPGASRKEHNQEHEDEDAKQWVNRPRKGSIFWRDVAQSVRTKGSRRTAGVAGQFASFENTRPGYYGELGYVIIHQTICNLFPPASFHGDSTLPLTPNDFIQRVLVPEAAVSLITEDMDQSRKEAILTLRESADYGIAMFPDDHSDDITAVNAGERIIMERARARRRELEEEGEELWESLEESGCSRRRDKSKRKANWREAEESEESDDNDPDDGEWTGSATSRKNKPKAKAKAEARTGKRVHSKPAGKDADVESDMIMLTDGEVAATSHFRQTRSRTRNGNIPSRSARTRTMVSDIDVTSDDEEALKPPSRPLPRRKRLGSTTTEGRLADTIRQEREIDVDATPRPQKMSRASSVSSMSPTGGSERQVSHPLHRARARDPKHAQTIEKAENDWSYTMRHGSPESIDDDVSSVTAGSSNRVHHLRHQEKASKPHSWLLSDSSALSTPANSP